MAVADGHGDTRCSYAHIGSRLAVTVACEALKKRLRTVVGDPCEYWNSIRREIATDIVKGFMHTVTDDYLHRCKEAPAAEVLAEWEAYIDAFGVPSGTPKAPDEIRALYVKRKRVAESLRKIVYLYGTTVRASVVTEGYVFSIALGDGDTVAVTEDEVIWLLPKSEAYGCQTESLCDAPEQILQSFRFSYLERAASPKPSTVSDVAIPIMGVMLASDGFRNSFFSESLFASKVSHIVQNVRAGVLKAKQLKKTYEKLTAESFFQDDITTALALFSCSDTKEPEFKK